MEFQWWRKFLLNECLESSRRCNFNYTVDLRMAPLRCNGCVDILLRPLKHTPFHPNFVNQSLPCSMMPQAVSRPPYTVFACTKLFLIDRRALSSWPSHRITKVSQALLPSACGKSLTRAMLPVLFFLLSTSSCDSNLIRRYRFLCAFFSCQKVLDFFDMTARS